MNETLHINTMTTDQLLQWLSTDAVGVDDYIKELLRRERLVSEAAIQFSARIDSQPEQGTNSDLSEAKAWVTNKIVDLCQNANEATSTVAVQIVNDFRLLSSELISLRANRKRFPELPHLDFLQIIAETLLEFPSSDNARQLGDTLEDTTQTMLNLPLAGLAREIKEADADTILRKKNAWISLKNHGGECYRVALLRERLGLRKSEITKQLGIDESVYDAGLIEATQILRA